MAKGGLPDNQIKTCSRSVGEDVKHGGCIVYEGICFF